MIQIHPSEFLSEFCRPFDCLDHHFTGPPHVRQPENNGSVFSIEGQILAAYAHKCGGPVLEIGSDLGISSRYIHEGLDKFDSHFLEMGMGPTNDLLFCVDIYHKWEDDPAWPRRRRINGDSASYNGPRVAWAFVDGDHQYAAVLKDIETLKRLDIRRAFFHDTSATMPAATGPSAGSDARSAVQDGFDHTWKLYDIQTPCGLIYATKKNLGDKDE